MLKPYRIVEQSETETTYEFKTIFLWVLYAIMAVVAVGYVIKVQPVWISGLVCMVVYFFTISTQYRRLGAITKRAALEGSVKYSGSKWSFKNPLRVSIPNTTQ